MECEKIKEEFPKLEFPPCCESCHEDEATGYGSDLWFEINGVDRHICCVIINTIKKSQRLP